jgi:hypothetical protein
VGEIRSRNEHQPHAKGTCCPAMYSQIKADREALSCACGARLEGLPNAPKGKRNGNYKHGARSMEVALPLTAHKATSKANRSCGDALA